MSERIEGKIAAILDRATVVINRGSDHGVERGDKFYIYSLLGPFEDPDSGANLGTTTRIWGKVVATTVEDKFCIARTDTKASLYMPVLQSMFRTTRVELPIEETDITNHVERIGVGFSVMLEKQQAPEIEEAEGGARSIEPSQEEDRSGQPMWATHAEGRIDEMGTSFSTRHGSAYVLSDEQSHEILYVLRGDSSQLNAHKGQSVRVQGTQVEEQTEKAPGTFEVTSVTPL